MRQLNVLREHEENNLPELTQLFFLCVLLNLTHIAELRKENLVKHIGEIVIQTGRLFFSCSLIFLIPLFFAVSANAQSNVNERKLKSVALNLGHHSIGFPFSFRTPLHFNPQVDINWNLNASKPNRLYTTSLGYSRRPEWTDDFYVLTTYNPVRNIGNDRFYYAWRVGLGILMSIHKNQIYKFEDGNYVPKKANIHFSPLIVLGLESGFNLKDDLKLGVSYDWRVQVPHGGGLPILPHSHYNLKLTYVFK